MTFVHMPRIHGIPSFLESTDENHSAVFLSDSNREIKNSAVIQTAWLARQPIKDYTYIDDTNGIERLNLKTGTTISSTGRQMINLHAQNSEIFYNEIRERSGAIGMKINPQKTQLLCISNAGHTTTSSYIRVNNDKVVSSPCLKICGYNFGSKPTVTAQFEVMERKFNERAWALTI